MLTNEELDEHPDNIEGLEGLDPSWEINYNELEFGNELARGNFGAVSIANYLGTKVAVKKLFDLDDEMKIYLQREINVLKQLRHPNVVQFLGLSKSKDGLFLITEFVPRGDLSRLLYDMKITELSKWKLRLQIMIQAAQGLSYVHAKKLIHRDVKAANFLVGDNWHVKLCDFGFSRSISSPPTKGAKQAAGNQMTLCVPEDHELLTNEGFMDLNTYLARQDEAGLLVAGYNPSSSQMVFEQPIKLYEYSLNKTNIVEFSNAHEMLDTWRDGAGDYGVIYGDKSSLMTVAEAQSNGVSLLVTKDHMMYAQWGNAVIDTSHDTLKLNVRTKECKDEDGKRHNTQLAYEKIKANKLLAYSDKVGARLLAAADAGVGPREWPAPLEAAFAELRIVGDDKKLEFLHLFGYWLGDGSFWRVGGSRRIHFTTKQHDVDWLRMTLENLGLTENDMIECTPSPEGRVDFYIVEERWVAFFMNEYGHKYGKHGRTTGTGAARVANLRELVRASCTPIVAVQATHAATAAARAAAARDAGCNFESTAAGSMMQPEDIKSVKWLPLWAWLLGQREMRALIDGLRRADGKWAQNKKVIWTSSARFRDELVRLLLMAGYTARFRCEYTTASERNKIDGRVITARHDSWAVMYAENDNTPAGSMSARPVVFKVHGEMREREFTGRVWCFTMPSGFVWARRAFKNAQGVVTKASRPLIIGNCGTDEWMAPETMMGLDYNQTADVFSFGVFISEMIFRAEPRQRSPGQGFRFDVASFQRNLPGFEIRKGIQSTNNYSPLKKPR